jgi:hypothetical protein
MREVGRAPRSTARTARTEPRSRARTPAGGAGALLELQATRGNRAVTALVQRAKLNIRASSSPQAGTISGVSGFPHRPPSNLGSQGQHLTAYVAFVDTILSNVRDRTPVDAARQLIWVATEFKKLPAMASVGQWNKHIHASLDLIVQRLDAAIKSGDPGVAAATVGAEIDQLLSERNRVPGTAIGEKDTIGHGESKTAGALEVMETALRTKQAGGYGAAEAEQAVQELWRLLDYDPPDPDDKVKLETVSKRVLTHLMSMRLAYPQVWQWLSSGPSKFWMIPYLRANRKLVTALGRLTDPVLGEIQNQVHAAL